MKDCQTPMHTVVQQTPMHALVQQTAIDAVIQQRLSVDYDQSYKGINKNKL